MCGSTERNYTYITRVYRLYSRSYRKASFAPRIDEVSLMSTISFLESSFLSAHVSLPLVKGNEDSGTRLSCQGMRDMHAVRWSSTLFNGPNLKSVKWGLTVKSIKLTGS